MVFQYRVRIVLPIPDRRCRWLPPGQSFTPEKNWPANLAGLIPQVNGIGDLTPSAL